MSSSACWQSGGVTRRSPARGSSSRRGSSARAGDAARSRPSHGSRLFWPVRRLGSVAGAARARRRTRRRQSTFRLRNGGTWRGVRLHWDGRLSSRTRVGATLSDEDRTIHGRFPRHRYARTREHSSQSTCDVLTENPI